MSFPVTPSDFKKKKPPPAPFSHAECTAITQAMDRLHATQAGAIKETFTVNDLRQLFVPPSQRVALDMVYQMETAFGAKGNIIFDVAKHAGRIMLDMAEPNAVATIESAVLQMKFDRNSAPDGFITPERFYGTAGRPLDTLRAEPEDLRRRFVDNCILLAKVHAEWTLVKWVFQNLQISLRSPGQMRYAWPAIYPLATTAELKMDLSQPSVRAGANAAPAPIVRPYLRDSNDVVARSSLMGIQEEHLQSFAKGDLRVVALELRLNDITVSSNL